jgi:hypothetical protein
MRCKAIVLNPEIAADPKLGKIFDDLCRNQAGYRPPLPDGLIGDIIAALAGPLPTAIVDNQYGEMMQQIVKGGRWMQIIRRLDLRRTKNYEALHYLTELFCRRLWFIGNGMSSFEPKEGEEAPAAAPVEAASKATEDEWLEQLACLYADRMVGQVDASSGLVDDFAFVALNLALRAERVEALTEWMDEPLVMACLGVEWDPLQYEPRLLRIITRLGDEDEALPGDYLSVRGVTKKTREDQIPRILSSELGLWIKDNDGKRLTMDKIINRAPSIYEHFDTRHPENRHRVFLQFIIDVEKEGFSDAEEEAAKRAECEGKVFAFDLLINAALHVPDNIEVDVAWMERRALKKEWIGRGFKLMEIEPRRGHDESWRNLTRVDRLLPHLFIQALAGQRTNFVVRSKRLAGDPKEHLAKALHSGRYEACLVVCVSPTGCETRSLPPPSLHLPRADASMNTVLLASIDLPQSKEQTTVDMLHGEAFRDLQAARLGPKPLDSAQPADLTQALLEMLVGPSIHRQQKVTVSI